MWFHTKHTDNRCFFLFQGTQKHFFYFSSSYYYLKKNAFNVKHPCTLSPNQGPGASETMTPVEDEEEAGEAQRRAAPWKGRAAAPAAPPTAPAPLAELGPAPELPRQWPAAGQPWGMAWDEVRRSLALSLVPWNTR